MRAFIAAELNEEIKERLRSLQDGLKEARADVKWVEPGNIHLTLKFLGEVEENKIPGITRALNELCPGIRPFNIALSGLGAFPGLRFPRVVWIGLKDGNEQLTALANLIENSLTALKLPKEKRGFSAHCTLGRVRSGVNTGLLAKKISEIPCPEFRQDIKSISLFKSTLGRAGAVYEKLSEINLTKS